MDAITTLKDDHKAVEALFKRFEKAGDRAYSEKRAIVDRIVEELSKHAAIEEQLFYPVSRATVPDTEDIALESMEEHHVVKWLLSELEDMSTEHERFDAKVTVLIENVRHHVEEEENELFPKIRDAFTNEELYRFAGGLHRCSEITCLALEFWRFKGAIGHDDRCVELVEMALRAQYVHHLIGKFDVRTAHREAHWLQVEHAAAAQPALNRIRREIKILAPVGGKDNASEMAA